MFFVGNSIKGFYSTNVTDKKNKRGELSDLTCPKLCRQYKKCT